MVNQNVVNSWKVEHYIAYLYLSIADADNETTEEEIAMATRKMKKILDEYYKDHMNHAIVMNEVLGEVMNHTDAEKTDMINSLNKKFKLDEFLKTDLVSDLTDIIESDDTVSTSEHYMLSFIRVVLSKN